MTDRELLDALARDVAALTSYYAGHLVETMRRPVTHLEEMSHDISARHARYAQLLNVNGIPVVASAAMSPDDVSLLQATPAPSSGRWYVVDKTDEIPREDEQDAIEAAGRWNHTNAHEGPHLAIQARDAIQAREEYNRALAANPDAARAVNAELKARRLQDALQAALDLVQEFQAEVPALDRTHLEAMLRRALTPEGTT